jgi:hypothetical protein
VRQPVIVARSLARYLAARLLFGLSLRNWSGPRTTLSC